MLSVCIPVYNFDITKLIEKLRFLLKSADFPYEILIADDGSLEYYRTINRALNQIETVHYYESERNIGRSSIRNLLCAKAIYNYLLFLDCDSEILNEKFIQNYILYINTSEVIYGGRIYQEEKPEKKFRLHWNYGNKREVQSVFNRSRLPSKYFSSNNFLIQKTILEKYPFDENLFEYGHEDTLMGIEFFQNGIKIIHIDNPLLHAGLEDAVTFLEKAEAGVRNLLLITRKVNVVNLSDHIQLLKVFLKIEQYHLVSVTNVFWILFNRVLKFFILNFYWMKALDLYKLGLFCNLYKKSIALANDAP